MSCDPERVTGFVDGELDPESAAAVAVHIEGCAACRAQAEAERALRVRLKGLPTPALPAELAARVREAAAARRRPSPVPRVARWALPVAATLVFGIWLRGHAPFVAWDLARDHDKCFGRHSLPARVWSAEPQVVSDWFEQQETHLPALPDRVGDLVLVGARYCPLAALSLAPHVYYASATRQVSFFVVPHAVRIGREGRRSQVGGDSVRLLRLEGELIGIVGARQADVQAFEAALLPVIAARGAPRARDGIGAPAR